MSSNTTAAFNELAAAFVAIPATVLFGFAADHMHQSDRMGASVMEHIETKVATYHPSPAVAKINEILGVPVADLRAFILCRAPDNVENVFAAEKRPALLQAMLDVGWERPIRQLIAEQPPAAPTV